MLLLLLPPPHDACLLLRGRALILWRRLPEVAASISSWAAASGVADSVLLLDELADGPDVRGTGVRVCVCCAAAPWLPQGWTCSSVCPTHDHSHALPRRRCPAPPELEGLHREVLVRALGLLEAQGRVK